VPSPPRSDAPQRASGSRYIAGAGLDLLLFIGTPAIIIPVVMLARGTWATAQLYLFVASFGALGHHLPGMLRAYGDRGLFGRFRWRFVVAPVFLLASCITLAFVARSALTLAVLAWGTWHGAMQVHGFARIYDAKAGNTGTWAARLDQALALSWFVTVLAWSAGSVTWVLDALLKSGVPPVSAATVEAVRLALFAATGAITLAWLVRTALTWRRAPPSLLKLALLASALGFFAWANLFFTDRLLAVVLFETFHDVQYLSIVWLFNRRRAASDPQAGPFTRLLFRPRALLLVAYVALCFAYGSLNVVQVKLPQQQLATVLAGVLAASGFLHFYYDGFIWKLRESDTRAGLGIAGGAARRGPSALAPLGHGLKWAALFVLPLALLAATTTRALPEEERMLALADTLPDDAGAQVNKAVALERHGDLEGAVAAARRAHAITSHVDDATRAKATSTLAQLLSHQALARAQAGEMRDASALLREALPLSATAADALSDKAASQLDAQDFRGAEASCRLLLSVVPDHGIAHYNLGVALSRQGKLAEAHVHAMQAVRLLPDSPEARQLLEALRQRIETVATEGN
jgi:tetratricopeptide (TPR) repeat protein